MSFIEIKQNTCLAIYMYVLHVAKDNNIVGDGIL